ncbi:MAG: M20 family metallopeptidase [Desertimonas sp.]
MSERASAVDLVELRRAIHAEPEIGLHLPLTQAKVLAALDGLNLEISTGRQLSSVVAVLRGRRRGRAVLLRGDMDALALTEPDDAGPDDPPPSRFPGVMHACGHDLHVAGLVGAAQLLVARAGELEGDVVLMFQPGEEGYDGAALMIDEGVLDAAGPRVDAAYAVHVLAARVPHGVFVSRAGTVLSAADGVVVTVRGGGGHSAQPHLACDPVPAACEMVVAMQARLTRAQDAFDPVIIGVGRFEAGTIASIIPETARFEATVRSFSHDARAAGVSLVEEVCRGVASAYGVTVDVDVTPGYGPTVNDPGEVDRVEAVVGHRFGAGRFRRWEVPWPASEDFSRVLDVVPGAFVGLGATAPGADPERAANNHAPGARFDESVITDAAALLADLAVDALRRPSAR